MSEENMTSKRNDMATEIDPLFPGRHNYRHNHKEYYGENHRYKKKVICFLGAIAIVVGTTIVVMLVSIYLGQTGSPGPDINGTDMPLMNPSIINLASLSWPIEDNLSSPGSSSPSVNVSKDEITSALEEGMLMGLKRDKIEAKLSSRKITLKTGTPPYFHQKFSSTHSNAAEMVKQGYHMDCASKLLAKKLKLKKTEVIPVFNNLPAIQLITGCSPAVYGRNGSVPECQPNKKYREANGRCNNIEFPDWGSSFVPLRRMLLPDYSDGVSTPRMSAMGDELPSARLVSSTVHTNDYTGDEAHSTMLMQWGQFLDHDITATALSKGINGSSITCCNPEVLTDPSLQHPECFAISIPASDPFYSHFNQTCMEMVRSAAAPRCNTGHGHRNIGFRNQLNQITSFIDGSTIYGSTQEEQNQLRNFTNGTLATSEGWQHQKLLPLAKDISANDSGFTEWAQNEANVYKSGDSRVNEQIMLTTMHTVWMREHNRIAQILADLNPNWQDEKIFQEARRIVIAEIQHITYNEYLPQILGNELMDALNMKVKMDGFTDDYDSTINPSIANVFASAAFRFGHSQIQGVMKMSSAGDLSYNFYDLHAFFFNSFKLVRAGMVDELVSGQASMESRAADRFFTPQVTNHLFETRGALYGLDLVAINTQRGRDHGIPSYRAWRKHCGLSEPMMFSDLLDIGWPEPMVTAVKKVYSSVFDIDLYTGGLGEPHLPGAVVGPTFACIIADQFMRLKKGDRFWYETSDLPQAFTEAQLTQLRSTSLARIFCDNVESLLLIQPNVMVMPGEGNLPKKCALDDIPSLNLTHWQEA